jgi:hypothetical protein
LHRYLRLLLRHLEEREYSTHIRQVLLQYLHREAAAYPIVRRLLQRVRDTAEGDLLWSFGDFLSDFASRRTLGELIEIVGDERNRDARGPVATRIALYKSAEVAAVCRQFLSSRPEMPWAAITAARLQKLWDVAPLIEPFLRDGEGLRIAARAYFKALGAAHAKLS